MKKTPRFPVAFQKAAIGLWVWLDFREEKLGREIVSVQKLKLQVGEWTCVCAQYVCVQSMCVCTHVSVFVCVGATSVVMVIMLLSPCYFRLLCIKTAHRHTHSHRGTSKPMHTHSHIPFSFLVSFCTSSCSFLDIFYFLQHQSATTHSLTHSQHWSVRCCSFIPLSKFGCRMDSC